ncbi:MAG: SDR family NAD(P)-dependent oxidoreductase [Arhodomonas sp.]|nr:SDR family NAD(P)-dependent oxidoreductase [Arhodomonas sp.]
MAASGGIGQEFCRQLLARPDVHRLWAGARRPDTPALLELADAHPERMERVAVDITREDDLAALADRIHAATPRLHLVINAYGLLHDRERGLWPEKRLEDVHTEHLEAGFRVNAFAPLLVAKHLLPLLAHGERAVFASLSARVGSIADNRLGGWYTYRASKAAQNMITKGLAVEFSRRARAVIALALHPGTTDTELSEPFQGGSRKASSSPRSTPWNGCSGSSMAPPARTAAASWPGTAATSPGSRRQLGPPPALAA